MILPVIMAGGSGTRLWPVSRSMYPKQFLKLVGDNTMIQETVNRLSNLEVQTPMVICNNEHRFLVAEQLLSLGKCGSIILEPVGRNTAPAIALAALKAIENGDDPLLLVLAADHIIEDVKAFEKVVKGAIELACRNFLVTFGIQPKSAETGYGYIRRGEVQVDEKNIIQNYQVSEFVEKPDKKTAEEYLSSGDFYWNSGMFLFKASRYLEELGKYQPEILTACKRSMKASCQDLDFIRISEKEYKTCPSNSIDFAVMEKTDSAVVIPLETRWSDIGSWSSMLDSKTKDKEGNFFQGDVITRESKNCFVLGDNRLISVLGLENIIIVDTKDAILVAEKDSLTNLESVVAELKRDNRSEWEKHREVYRPWGKFDLISTGNRYQVKHITVKPGAKLSVQLHHHRAEHWIVVSGTAKVINNDKEFLVSENESTYIPIGQVHALENPGKVPLELIEIQTGSYLGEDDIVRLDDMYGRI